MRRDKSLLEKIYFEPLYTAVARIIGYEGKSPFEFWDAAKELKAKYGESAVMFTMMNLTRYDRRESPSPRYELTNEVKKLCWQLLGPQPEDEEAFFTNRDGTPVPRPAKEAPQQEPAPLPKTEEAKAVPRRRVRKKKTAEEFYGDAPDYPPGDPWEGELDDPPPTGKCGCPVPRAAPGQEPAESEPVPQPEEIKPKRTRKKK